MKYVAAIFLAGAILLCAMACSADDSRRGEGSFVSNAISDMVDKVDNITSGREPILESVDDYEMSSDGKRIPKKYGDKGKRTALEEKLAE